MRQILATPSHSRGVSVALWVVTVMVAALFVLAGAMKFYSVEMADEFERWGYPGGFHLLIGAVELIGAALLLMPRTAFLGAGALAVVMIGAFFTHVFHMEWLQSAVPAVVFALLAWIAYERTSE